MYTLFKVTEPSSIPYRTHPACAKRATYSDPPPVILLPESDVAQAAYAETLLPGSASARLGNVSRYWGSPRACYRIPPSRSTPGPSAFPGLLEVTGNVHVTAPGAAYIFIIFGTPVYRRVCVCLLLSGRP